MEANPQRHQRTALLVSALAELDADAATRVLEEIVLGLEIEPELATTAAGQATLLTAVNVLARTAGAISLEVPSTPLLLAGLPWEGDLRAVASQLATWVGARVADRPAHAGVRVGISTSHDYVLATGDAWHAFVDTPSPRLVEGPIWLGAVAAGHLAAARAFHIALADVLRLADVDREPATLALCYGEGDAPRPEPVGDITVVGAGAVGNALLWALVVGGAQVNGAVELFDPQALDATNMNRHLLAGVNDVGKAKAEIAATFAAARIPNIHPRVERFAPPARPPFMLVSTVDNDEARYQAQATFPNTLLHGATGGENVAVAALDFTRGACVGCLFPRGQRSQAELIAEETGLDLALVTRALRDDETVTPSMFGIIAQRMSVQPETLKHLVGRTLREVYVRELCGRLPAGRGPDAPAATIAYASGLAGALLAAEVVKGFSPAYAAQRLSNYIQVNASEPGAAWLTFREKQDDCPLMCATPALQAAVQRLRSGE